MTMSQKPAFEQNPALKMAREKAKTEFLVAKRSIATGPHKSAIGSFIVEISDGIVRPKPPKAR
jgi:hypothetical protein